MLKILDRQGSGDLTPDAHSLSAPISEADSGDTIVSMAKVATFITMLAFWVIMSGMFDAFHLTLGIISCLLVTLLSQVAGLKVIARFTP